MSDISVKKFFLGSHTCTGFFSLFNKLYDPKNGWYCYILKGGPGTGKSTLMKKIASAAETKYAKIELIYCSSDPNSLDAVIIPEIKTCIADGTAPHVLEPKYPGASEKIINLGEYWNDGKLQKNSKILMDLFEKNKNYHEKTAQFLKSLGEIKKSANRILDDCIEHKRLNEFIERFLKSTFGSKKIEKTEIEKVRFLDAITPSGHMFFEDSIADKVDNIYIIEDKYDAVSNEFLQKIRSEAITQNLGFVSCLSPFSPATNLRAIHIPALSASFMAKNPKIEPHAFNSFKNAKKINATKFLNSASLNSHKNLLGLHEKASSALLDEAIKNLSHALDVHDEIEKFYISSMNHRKIDKTADKLISAIL